MMNIILNLKASYKSKIRNTYTKLLVWSRKSKINQVLLFVPAIALLLVLSIGLIYIYLENRKNLAVSENISEITQTSSVKITDKDGANEKIAVFNETSNNNFTTDTSASPEDILDWRKQIKVSPITSSSDTTIYETIKDSQNFIKDSLIVPPGWKAQWSTSATNDPKAATYSDIQPDSGVKHIKLFTDTVSTTQPATQSSLIKPLDQEPIASKEGLKVMSAKEYNNKIYVFYKSVNVIGSNDPNELTIGCLDLTNYQTCKLDDGSDFPSYLSSQIGPIGQGPKDINTPPAMQYGFKDGKLFMPAQKGSEFGINCVDLASQSNCGFYSRGTTAVPTNQQSGRNPVMITGFAQEGDKLYGHANFNDADSNNRDDYVQVTCFDMSKLNSNGNCDGFNNSNNSTIPSLYTPEHNNEFSTPSQSVISGNKYYFLMNYNQDNLRKTLGAYYTQTLFGDRLVCYDVSKSSTPASSTCDNWPSGTYQVDCTNTFLCGGALTQTARGAMIYPEETGNSVNPRDGFPTPTQLFFNKNQAGQNLSLCIMVGQFTNGAPTYNGDPGIKCFLESNGTGGGTTPKPSGILPTQWLNVPWQPGTSVTQIVNDSQDRTFLSFKLGGGALGSGGNVFNVQGPKTAVICYDWKTSSRCKDSAQLPNNTVQVQGFRLPHYWYEINSGNAADSAYIEDGECLVGVSEDNYLWSFDSRTGESPCRKTTNEVELKPSVDLDQSYCDGGGLESRDIKYASLKFDDLSLFDFEKINVTIKDKNGNLLQSFNDVDLKDPTKNGKLDISSVPFSGDTAELRVEVNGVLLNTSPWSNSNLPKATIIFDGQPAQYCYKTQVKDLCNISQANSFTDINVVGKSQTKDENDTLLLEVEQEQDKQCFKNLQISIGSSNQAVSPGQEMTYNIDINNTANINTQGLGVVTGARIEATIPESTTLVSATEGYTIQSNKLIWANQTINPQANLQKTVTFKVNSTLANIKPADSNTAQAATSNVNFSASVFYDNDTTSTSSGYTNSSVILITPDPPPSEPSNPPDETDEGTGFINPDAEGDRTPPSAPSNLNLKEVTSKKVSLNWNASTDDSGSVYYQIIRDDILIASTFSNNYDDQSVEQGKQYKYQIRAVDSSGNISEPSNLLTIDIPLSIEILPIGRVAQSIVNIPESIINAITGARTQPAPSNNPITIAIDSVAAIAKSSPRAVVVGAPYLLISILFGLALLFAFQSVREYRLLKNTNYAILRYRRILNASRNFVVLTGHYINTPISIMQLSSELFYSQKIISKQSFESIKSTLIELRDDSKNILSKKYASTEYSVKVADPNRMLNLSSSFSTNLFMLIPIIFAGLFIFLGNLILWRSEIINFNSINTPTQLLLFLIASILLFLTWRGLNKNKELRKIKNNQLESESLLLKNKLAFIDEMQNSIGNKLGKLNSFALSIKTHPDSEKFINGLDMLKGLSTYFAQLKEYSEKPPNGHTSSLKITKIVDEILKENIKSINLKNLTIKKDLDSSTIDINESATYQLLSSSISNAVKFSNSNGTIKISSREKNHETILIVEDNGIGIEKAKIDDLLQPFSRATDPMKFDYEGIGLGLYIDRLILQQMGGNIEMESELKKGTRITFRLPKK